MRCLAAALFLAAPLLAQQCTYTLDKTTVNLPATASATNTVKVTATPETCRWIPNVTAGVGPDGRTPWLHLAQTSQQVFTGSGTFTFSADANPIGATRTGTITVVSENTLNPFVNVTQDAAACNFGFTPTAQTFPVNGGSGAVTVTANCAWAVSSNAGNWLTIPFTSAGGITNAVVPITVAANTCASSRTATIFLSGSSLPKNLTSNLTQDGSASNFSLSGNSASVDAKESDNRFTVNTGTGCGWSATSDVTWMQITGGAFGTGNAPIAFHVIANTSAERTGSIHVTAAPGIQLTYTVTQAASGPPVPTMASVNNAANYATDAISPGTIITIFGQNMGSSPLVPLQVSDGKLTTTLGGTQVLFDGVPAPMIYSLKTQVSAIAPYGLAGKTSTKVQVSYNGGVSDAITVPVRDSTPAIFTLDSSGLGPGAILNQDYNVNSSSVPAARGSVVSIYANGGGAVDPAVTDGAILGSTLSWLKLPVSVTISGADTKVLYYGLVPGSIAGLVQINAEVPQGIVTGPKVPITIKVGGVSSTAGVTISVQ